MRFRKANSVHIRKPPRSSWCCQPFLGEGFIKAWVEHSHGSVASTSHLLLLNPWDHIIPNVREATIQGYVLKETR